MIRALLAVTAGIAIAVIAISVLESLGHALYPPPTGLDPHGDPEAFAIAVKQMPPAALIVVLLAWALGTFSGAWLATRLSDLPFYGLLVGVVMMFAGVAQIVAIPHPWWFTICGIVLFIPSAYVGGRLAMRSR